MSQDSISAKLLKIFILHKAGAFSKEEYELLKSLMACCEENNQLNVQNGVINPENVNLSFNSIEN